jgi:signal recognition particle subunit SRP19
VAETMIIWLANIDASRPRSAGRKMPKGLALQSPDLKELSKAAHNLGLTSQREPDKLYPKDRACDQDPLDGRLVIAKRHTKHKTLRILADEVRRIRKERREKKSSS